MRAAAEENRLIPSLRAFWVAGSSVSLNFAATSRRSARAGWKLPSLAAMNRLMPWAAPETFWPVVFQVVRKLVELVGAVGELGEAGGGLVDRFQGVAGLLEGLGGGGQGLGRVGGDLALDDRGGGRGVAGLEDLAAGARLHVDGDVADERPGQLGDGALAYVIPPLQSQGDDHAVGLVGPLVEGDGHDLADADAALAHRDALEHAGGLGIPHLEIDLVAQQGRRLAEPDDHHRQDQPRDDDEQADPELHDPFVHD